MTYPVLIFVSILVVAAVAAVGFWLRVVPPRSSWVAATSLADQLPRLRTLMRRRRTSLWLRGLALAVTCCVVALLAGMPANFATVRKNQLNRDIVLCLDVSGSMLQTDAQVTKTFSRIVDQFHGERVGLQMWNYANQTIFPLTDDYDMAREQLRLYGRLFTNIQVGDGVVYVSQELLDRLKVAQPDNKSEGASLIADGVAGCVLAFPPKADGRQRTLIVATDNQPQGKSIYTMDQAFALAKDRKIKVFGLYSASNMKPGADQEDYTPQQIAQQKKQFQEEVEKTGGKLFDVTDTSSVEDIMKSITARPATSRQTGALVSISDNNGPYVVWLFLLVTGLLVVTGVTRT